MGARTALVNAATSFLKSANRILDSVRCWYASMMFSVVAPAAEEQDDAVAIMSLQILGHDGDHVEGPGAHEEVIEPNSILEGV